MERDEIETNELEQEKLLPLSEARELLDIIYLINAILRSSGNISQAAKQLGIGRRTIYDLMEKHGISCAAGKISIELNPILSHVELRLPQIEKCIY